MSPDLQPTAAIEQAIALQVQGNLREAERRYQAVLREFPDQFDALHLLGVIRQKQGRHKEAVEMIRAALRRDAASAAAHYNLGISLAALGRHQEAAESYESALAIHPKFPRACNNLGNALCKLKRFEEAIPHFTRALSIDPNFADAQSNLGAAMAALNRHEEAIESYRKALAIRPLSANALNNLANALRALRRYDAAIARYREALAISPQDAEIHGNLGIALAESGRHTEAIASYRRAIAAAPRYVEPHISLGDALFKLRRLPEAVQSYRKALEIDPERYNARSGCVRLSYQMCDWQEAARHERLLPELAGSGEFAASPYFLQTGTDDPLRQLRGARHFLKCGRADEFVALWNGTRYRHDRIRLGYLSADFHDHATAYLMAELFERHDRERFEVTAVSWGPKDGGAMRRRLERAFDRFLDVREMSDHDIARKVRSLEIDVAVDLKGYTEDCRPGVLARRPAPIQVNYLGYPGTMGAPFIDYVVADPFVVPSDQQEFFTEKLVHLPECYQPNDTKRPIAETAPSRAQCGLPERGFVFACFNNSYKLTPEFFDVWMRLLQAVPGSVLWLLQDNKWAPDNLRREARVRGVAPERLVFAPRAEMAEHLARQRLADLFLDTLPCNAHTTASDALWAGLPVLTCAGRSFAARVAGSLLQAVGLPELITHDIADYEALALRLAREPELLAGLRNRLAANRLTAPLFDCERYCRHLEAAYEEMWRLWQQGETPRAIAVAPLPRG
jgi:predicted O-linked N-acetylglucosamine transferase (SPINDLY family)